LIGKYVKKYWRAIAVEFAVPLVMFFFFWWQSPYALFWSIFTAGIIAVTIGINVKSYRMYVRWELRDQKFKEELARRRAQHQEAPP
jgi:hypothetical protein